MQPSKFFDFRGKVLYKQVFYSISFRESRCKKHSDGYGLVQGTGKDYQNYPLAARIKSKMPILRTRIRLNVLISSGFSTAEAIACPR